MPQSPESNGHCLFCGETITPRGALKHLQKCPKRLGTIQSNEANSPLPAETLWHLRIQSADDKAYWLDLEMKGSAKLTTLDKYLRAIWLECCNHLSEFNTGGRNSTKIPASRVADAVFEAGVKLRHIYDFGTTSETDIRVMGSRKGSPLSKHPIYLMARNIRPEVECQECDQMAGWLCLECSFEDDQAGFLCEEHAGDHPHQEYGAPIPLSNSPRVGMCGYVGPATPPY